MRDDSSIYMNELEQALEFWHERRIRGAKRFVALCVILGGVFAVSGGAMYFITGAKKDLLSLLFAALIMVGIVCYTVQELKRKKLEKYSVCGMGTLLEKSKYSSNGFGKRYLEDGGAFTVQTSDGKVIEAYGDAFTFNHAKPGEQMVLIMIEGNSQPYCTSHVHGG